VKKGDEERWDNLTVAADGPGVPLASRQTKDKTKDKHKDKHRAGICQRVLRLLPLVTINILLTCTHPFTPLTEMNIFLKAKNVF
jgi:hypothetical protein